MTTEQEQKQEMARLSAMIAELGEAQKQRLYKEMLEGKRGWDKPSWEPEMYAHSCLLAGVVEQDPAAKARRYLDAINFLAFAWYLAGGEA